MLGPANSPHLVLGMRSDDAPGNASMHFALATKQLRNSTSSDFSIEDLTSALSAIESGSTNGDFWYALPCDSSVINSELSMSIAGKVRSTVDEYLSAVGELSPSTQVFCGKCGSAYKTSAAKFCGSCGNPAAGIIAESESGAGAMLTACLSALFNWRWNDAVTLGLEVLRISNDESKRDEALSLTAAAYCMLDQPDRALGALRHAVKGEWNLGLQANLAIVATSQDPSLAVEQMRFLIDGADSAADRLEACLKAVALWGNTQSDLTGSNDPDDHENLPASLLSSIIRLLESPDLSEEDFFKLGYFLAENEGDRLISSTAFENSPYKNSPSAELIRCRVKGFHEYLNNVVRIATADKGKRPWLNQKAEHTVTQINGLLSDSETSEVAASIAFTLLEQGLDASTIPRIIIRALATLRVTTLLSDSDSGVPSENFIAWLIEGKRGLDNISLLGDGVEQPDFLASFMENAGQVLAAHYHDHYLELLHAVAPAVDRINYQMGGFMRRMRTDKLAVTGIARQISALIDAARKQIPLLLELTSNPELRESLNNILEMCDDINRRVAKY